MSQNQSTLVWKPKAALWISLFFLLVSVFFWAVLLLGPARDKTVSNAILSSIYFFPALWGTIYGLRTRVEANENGAVWRDWRGVWRAAKWDEIGDFYTVTSKGAMHRVETAAGKFDFDLQGDGKLLADLIPKRAINARVREWDIIGERPCDPWPRRFVFWRADLAVAERYALLFLLTAVGLTIYLLWFRLPPRGEISTGAYVLAYVAPPLLIPVVPFLFWLFFCVQERQARPFRGQNVEVSPSGLVWNGATRIETSWAQIETWNWKKRGKIRFLSLQTANGNIEIPDFGIGLRAFYRIAERFSGVPLVKAQQEESMAVVPVQNAPDDTLIFNFNNLGMQSMGWYFSVIGVATFCGALLLRWADPETPRYDETFLSIFGAAIVLISLSWMWFLRIARLRLSLENLEWSAPFFRRSVAWRDIESFGKTASNLDWIEVGGGKFKLSLFNLPVAQRSKLHAEIEKRAFNARGNWE